MAVTHRDRSWNGGKETGPSLRARQRSVIYRALRDQPGLTIDALHPLVDQITLDRALPRIKEGKLSSLLDEMEQRGEVQALQPGSRKWARWSVVPREQR